MPCRRSGVPAAAGRSPGGRSGRGTGNACCTAATVAAGPGDRHHRHDPTPDAVRPPETVASRV